LFVRLSKSISIFADPLKLVPAIVRAFASIVAVAALPVISSLAVIKPAPLVIALLFNEMFDVPSKDTPAIVRAFARAVAVAALPVVDPDEPETLPVTLPVNAPTKVVAVVTPVKNPSPSLLIVTPAPTIKPDLAVTRPTESMLVTSS